VRPSLPFFLLLVGGAALVPAGGARADEPLEIPTSRTITVRGGRCWAYTDVATKVTTAYRRGKLKKKPTKLWSIDGWYRVAALAADCEHFVTGYDGGNLLPEGYARDTVLLAFYRRGILIRQVTVAELIKDLSKLEKTVSHWSWGYYVGVEKGTHYRVGTVDRGEIVFDMKTGLPVE
jgi:hypothetical protein